MARDEFNVERITNEGENPNFEFGNTQDNESTSYFDNDDRLRDEVNDNPTSNNENNSPEKKEKRRKEEQKEKEGSDKSSNGSSGSSGSSAAGAGSVTAAGAAVVAAVSIVTGIVSVGAGPFPPEVDKVILTPHETSINCGFDIFNSDSTIKYKVELYNDEIEQRFEKESQIGHNELEFTDLASSTEYTFEIFRGNPNEQQEYSYQSIYSELVTTLENPVPTPSEFITLSFDADNRGGTMSSLEFETGSEYTLPVCIYVPFEDEYFGGWKINGEGEMLQPGETITVNSDTTLVAGWSKFPTKENTVTATGSNFFYLFPEQPSTNPDTITLMGVDFLYKNTYYSSDSQNLNIVNDATNPDGFVSTTAPFGGPISSITINTNASQSGDVDFTMVYSASPIYEKTTEQGETHTLAAGSTYTFECTNPDARYFCLSTATGLEAFISSMEFVYKTPVIENSFNIYFDANGGSGSFGPYTVRNLNKRELPDIETIGFTAPEGYEFAGWKVKSVEDLLDAGTVIGISSDITLVAQWKEKGPAPNYTITFITKGGSTVESQTVEEGSCVIKPDDPTREGFIFLDWYTDSESTNPYDFDEPVTSDLVLTAGWKPDIEFSMYINYFDSLSSAPSYQLSYSYTKKDDYSLFVDYSLEIEGNETIDLSVSSLENTDTALTQTLQLDSSALTQLGSGIVNYAMKGYTSIGETFDLATGSFSASRTQKDHVAFIYFGDKELQEDNTGETFHVMKSGSSSSSSYYIPVRFDYADFTNKHRADSSEDWRLRYTLDGETYTNATFSYSSGTAFINIGSSLFQAADTVTFKEISFLDGNSTPQQIGDVYKNVTVQASDEKYVGGFRLNTSYLLNPSRTPTFTLSGVGTRGVDLDNPNDNHRFINLGVNDDGFKASLAFRLLSKNGQIEKEYTIDVTQKFIDNASEIINYTNVEFDFIDENTGVDKRDEFIEQSKRFVTDAELTIVTGGTTIVCTSYESYSFR